MIRNYVKIAWRNLVKNKTFSIINIAGLAIGLACFILIALYVVDETSYDRYNEKADRIYRINSDLRIGGVDLTLATSSDPMGAALKDDFPQVEQFVRFYASSGSKLIKDGDQYINESRVVHVDSTFFDVFTLSAIAGDPHTALTKPNTVVITESAANRYFGTTDAVGKSLETNDHNGTRYQVTAVIEDIPSASHFDFDFFFSMANVSYPWGNFLSHNFQTYILLKAGTDPEAFEKNFAQVVDKHVMPQAKQYMDINSMEEFNQAGNRLDYSLIPLTDIHLHSDRHPELGVNGNIQYVYIFVAVALFILLLACVNFMNLSTARSASRAKEVGIRKVLGTERRLLISQFIIESILTVLVGLLLAIGLVALTLSSFNAVAGKELSMLNLLRPAHLFSLVLLTVIIGTLAGLYPALFLSAFRPIKVLKGTISGGFQKSNLRSSLVIFQFITTIIIIASTLIVFRQLNFIQNKKIGFDKEQILVINGTNALGTKTESFKNEVAKMNGVTSASFAGFLPVSNSSRSDNSFSTDAVMNESNMFNMQIWDIDYDYITTLDMHILEGRNFSPDYGTDSTGILINEAAAKLIGYSDPVGRTIYMPNDLSSPPTAYTVVGVVEDFHFESLRQHIGPLSMRLGNNKRATAFKVDANDVHALVSSIETQWKSMAPGMPFSYQFLDESFESMYRAEQRVGKVALSFSILAIIIAALGLFGLTTYMVEQRTKELGIRKVLGASISGIVALLSRDFIRLVLLAILIASPIAWWVMNRWLEDFAYRIEIQWWMFAVAGLAAVVIALLTVSWQAVRAAVANPVDSLRDE